MQRNNYFLKKMKIVRYSYNHEDNNIKINYDDQSHSIELGHFDPRLTLEEIEILVRKKTRAFLTSKNIGRFAFEKDVRLINLVAHNNSWRKKDVAENISVSPSYISRVLSGQRMLSYQNIVILRRLLKTGS